MISIQNLTVNYGEKVILNSISLDLYPDEFCFILGPNGAGKSTLLKSINGVKPPLKGEILLDGNKILSYHEKKLAQKIAYIPQEFYLPFDYTVFEFILLARYPWLGDWNRYRPIDTKIVEQYLEQLNLGEYRERTFNHLSGGEKQKVLIARALVQKTGFLLMDESLSHLDLHHQIEFLTLLQNIQKLENKSLIIVSHNLNLAAEFAKRIVFLRKGKIVATGSPMEIFTEEILNMVFGVKFSIIKNPFTKVGNIVYNPQNH